MKYSRILQAFYNTPLGLLPEKIAQIQIFLETKAAGEDVSAADIEAMNAARRDDGVQMMGRVAVVPVFGVLAQRASMLDECSGACSAERIGVTLDGLVRDKGVKAIVLAFDSPGGSVFGIPELADKIRSLRDEKKIVGIADSLAASAAYWLLSQCTEINVTPGGQVGSIGVYIAHEDQSERMAAKGRKVSLISAGKYKVEDQPFAPLSDEARAELQRKVDQYYGMFVSGVAKGRGISEARVEKDFGQGRMALAKDAVDAGMADKVATIQQVLSRLGAAEGPAAQGVSRDMAHARAKMLELEESGS